MATTTTVTSTYAGFDSKKYVQASLLAGSTLANGLIEVLPNVNYKTRLGLIGGTGAMADATCDATPTGTVTLADVILTVKEMEIVRQLCKKDFLTTWEGEGIDINSMSPALLDQLAMHVGKQVAKEVETAIWEGTNTSGSFQGFANILSLAATLPAAQEVTGTTVTSANVVAEMQKVVDAIPQALYGSTDLVIYVAPNVYKAYARVLSGSGVGASGVAGNSTQWFSMLDGLSIDGIPIVMANGLAANKMIAGEKTNFFFGTSNQSDMNDVIIKDLGEYDGSQNVKVIYRWTAGCQIGVITDVVTYGIVNAAN